MAGRREVEGKRLFKKLDEIKARIKSHGVDITVPKYPQPSDFNIGPTPLFQLPPEILVPIFASGHPTYRKKLRQRQRQDELQRMKMQAFTALRREREEFRRRVIAIIVGHEGPFDPTARVPSDDERELMRYYFYIRYGIDDKYVAPIGESTLKKIYRLVPSKYKKWKKTHDEVVIEIKEDFNTAVKKSIVDFVLKDPQCEAGIEDFQSNERNECEKMSIVWKPVYDYNRGKIARTINIINPCIVELVDLWFTRFE